MNAKLQALGLRSGLKPVALSVLLLPACFGSAEQTNGPAPAEDLRMRAARAERSLRPLCLPDDAVAGAKTPVLLMEPMESETLRKLLPDIKVFRLVSSRDLVHGARVSALLLDTNGSPSHLQSTEDVCRYLSLKFRRVTSEAQALQIARAFTDLRSYKIVESPPDFPDNRPPEEQPEPSETDYKLVVENLENEWRVHATLFTSEYSGSYERFVFSIYKPPGTGVTVKERTIIRLRNYVY